MTEPETGASILTTLTTRSEIHVDLIKHILSLKKGDPVIVTGRLLYTPKPGCYEGRFYSCPSVGTIIIQELDGLSTSNYVKYWEIPLEQRNPWYLGKGLQEGQQMRYNLSSKIMPIHGDSFSGTVNLEFHKSPDNDDHWTTLVEAIDNNNRSLGGYHSCLFDSSSGALDCSSSRMPFDLKDLLDSTIFFLGREANEASPQPLSPIMSRWPDTTGFDYYNNHMFVFYRGNISLANGELVNATAVGWDAYLQRGYEPVTLFWIIEEFPFPLKAQVHRLIPNTDDNRQYSFELLDSPSLP